jgi:phenylacetic acid degradation protein
MPCYRIDQWTPVVHTGAFVHPTAVLIGDVIVGAGCYIGPAASLRGDFGRIVMHEGANVQDTCVVHGFPGSDTVIETDGHIGHGAVLHGCTVRRNALVGMNAVVMDEAEVGENAFVAASAFVRAGMRIPPGHLAAGVPAKVVRELSLAEMAWKVEGTRVYQALTLRCLNTMVEVEPLTEVEADRARIGATHLQPLIAVRRADGLPPGEGGGLGKG